MWDFQEIKVFKGSTETPENQIIWFEDGKLMLPTVNDMTKEVYKDIYSSEEINAFREYFAEQYGHNIDSEFWNTPVLPINSHPNKKDSDGDGILDRYDREALRENRHSDYIINYINNEKIKFSDIISDGQVSICTIPITELGFRIEFVPKVCYDEYGDEIQSNSFPKNDIINGYFDNWYIIEDITDSEIKLGLVYTKDCQKYINIHSSPFKNLIKAVDVYPQALKTIYNGYVEDGFWIATKDVFSGAISSQLESFCSDTGMLLDIVSVIQKMITPSMNSDLYLPTNISGIDLGSEQSCQAELTYEYLQFEKKYFNTDSDTFQAAKTIGYSNQIISDFGVFISGFIVGTGGDIIIGAGLAISPETGGASVSLVIPGAIAEAVGAGITATGAFLIASDANGFNNASQAMRDARMFDEDSLSYKIRNAGDDILDVSETGKGHTLEKHVSQTNEELIRRANKENVEAATSYTDKSTAVKAVKQNLRQNTNQVVEWLNSTSQNPLTIQGKHNFSIGKGVVKGRKNVIYDLSDSVAVLIKDSTNELGFIILTSYPIV